MGFKKVYECNCDVCGECCGHIYSKSPESIKTLRSYGIIVRGGKVYCSEQCYLRRQAKND